MASSRAGRDTQARFDIGALEQRVYGLEKAIGDISAGIAGLSTKIDERSKTPWVMLISAFTLLLAGMTTIGALVYRPIEATTDRHEKRLNAQDDRYIADLHRTIQELRSGNR